MSSVAAAVAAVAAAAALVVAVIALIVARRTLQEARTTTEAQRETLRATEAVVAGTGKLISRVEASTLALHMILTESQATQGIDLCREIARQVFLVKQAMQAVRDSRVRDWHELNDAKLLLAAMLSGLADEELPACRRLADPSTDPRTDSRSAGLAAEEIRVAIERWRLRLAEVATQANAQLRRLAVGSGENVLPVPESLSRQAEAAVGDVSEGICPLCRVGLQIHNGRASCACCGDSYRGGPSRLEVRRCPEHGRDCQHWETVWASRSLQ